MYWDPLPTVIASQTLPSAGSEQGCQLGPPGDYLRGEWAERDWRNVPGPFYGAGTDSCWAGRLVAPEHIVYEDDFGSEVVFRQPRNVRETQLVLTAAASDPFCAYAYDGDDHWTLELIRRWWAERARLTEWIDRVDHAWSASEREDERENAQGLRTYRRYVNDGLETYLREYGFWLEHRRAPKPAEILPDLNH
ncbi:ferredoxin [Nocardia sp. NPDC101769]|uniref:ferredoxin n=1 Tax=Nocardia sp. NPDC101769 TaxID=3364333 RepID=UPI003805CC15